ncbi:Ubiquitin-associated/translation elongation factor EF1B protein [Trifolium repens]|nr:Ubiquitin-associated/translation elongation factor EF1B protein [Trifolium repens]
MSPSMKSKSKSKEKASAKAVKEQQKTSPKNYGSTNDESGIPASVCDPITETVQTLETSLADSFAKINDTDDHSSSPQGTVSEYDSVSNNGSCSGESEDTKEKAASSSTRLDIIPGCDTDRRDKIRLKNERKHQRQRERRAHELHERCGMFLVSRKLEKLTEKLVAMGFSSERATLALKLNEGKLEESISWLIDGSEAKDTTKLTSESNLKIDISEELQQIYAMEVKYNCSKQEVERVVVACEGDLQKADDTLKSQKQESPMNQSEDSAQNNSLTRSHELQPASVSIQQRGNESDFNYYNVCGADSMFQDPENRNPQSLHMNHQNELTQKRWGVGVTASNPSNMLQSMQAMSPFVNMEAQPSAAYRNEGRMIHQGVGREPVVMMQHPHFADAKQNYLNSMNAAIPSATSGWYVNSVPPYENTRLNGNLGFLQNNNMGTVGTDRLQQLSQAPYKEYSHGFGPVDSSISSGGMGGFYKPMASSPSPAMPSHSQQHHGSWNTAASSPALTVPPSLGLFCGHQNPSARSFSSHSHVDWNTGGMVQEFDYNNIDWSLDCPSSSRSGDVWLGFSSSLRNSAGNRMASSYMTGSRNVSTARETSSSAGLRDWTSPFAGKDIFSVPRKIVTFPPM